MSRPFLISLVLLFALSAFGQGGFDTVIPAEPLGGNLLIQADSVYVSGHWVALDDHSKLAGPSVSVISCDHNQCTEQQANILVMGNTFSLTADNLEYKVERWTDKEIVAANVAGICRVRNVLKFDLVQKKVFSMQTLSEPIDEKLPKMSKDACKLVGMNLELKASALWVKK